MRILQVITSLQIGGAERLATQMAIAMTEMGHTVDVCVFNGEETIFTKELHEKGIKVIGFGTSVYNPLYVLKLAKLMRNYDIVHTHNSSPQLFVAIASMIARTGLCTTEHNTSNRKRNWKWYAPIESWMYGRYDHAVCISKIAEDKLRKYLGGKWECPGSDIYDKVSTINNGVDVNAIYRAEADRELTELKGDRKAIVMIAGFRQQKDQDTVVRAMSLLDKEQFEVWFAGIGVRENEVRKLAEEMGVKDRVRFLGLRSDVPNVLKAADIVVMSSHWEGLSLSNVEGMSAGKPFVASDVNGLREVTKGYGLMFPHGDSNALADIIIKLATDKNYATNITKRCMEQALKYDIRNMLEQYETVYRKIIANGKKK